MFNLSQEQVQAALTYIDTHRTEVEAEYQSILTEASELQAYWQDLLPIQFSVADSNCTCW